MSNERLDQAAIEDAVRDLTGWALSDDHAAITRDFRFRNFREAFAFMSECALAAEKSDHHPEWSNVYNKVHVLLSTHSAGGITRLDLEMARMMNAAAARFDV